MNKITIAFFTIFLLSISLQANADLLQNYHEGCMKGCLKKWKTNCLKLCNCTVNPFRGSSDLQVIKLLNSCKLQNKLDACKNYHLKPKTAFIPDCKPK